MTWSIPGRQRPLKGELDYAKVFGRSEDTKALQAAVADLTTLPEAEADAEWRRLELEHRSNGGDPFGDADKPTSCDCDVPMPDDDR